MKKSVYGYAADSGVPMGIYLTVLSFCLLLSMKIPSLPMLLVVLVPALPFLLAWLLRRIAAKEPSFLKFAPMWLAGIYIMIFGTLIATLVSAVYIVVFDPGFVTTYVESAITQISSSPMADSYAPQLEVLARAKERHLLPSGLEFIASMGWATCFFGSLLSIPVAAWVVYTSRARIRKAGA